MRPPICIALFLAPVLGVLSVAEDRSGHVGFRHADGKVVVTVDEKPIATYVYADAKIRRPYFAHVKAPGGCQVTRNHPPVAGRDRTDHQTMHPGPPSRIVVKPGEELRLRYAVWIHGGEADQKPGCAAAYADYLELAAASR